METTFDIQSAERIARVVRFVEGQFPPAKPLQFQPFFPAKRDSGSAFRVCTFTGSWSIATDKTVTFKYQTSTPNTVVATNLFWPVPDGGQRDCAIARDGTAWFLVTPQLYAANAAVDATLTTSAIEFTTLPVAALATASTATFSISITTCSTAAV